MNKSYISFSEMEKSSSALCDEVTKHDKMRADHYFIDDGAYMFNIVETEERHYIFMLIDIRSRTTIAVDFINTNEYSNPDDPDLIKALAFQFLFDYTIEEKDTIKITPISADTFRMLYINLICSKYK